MRFYVETQDILKARGKKDSVGTVRGGRRKIAEGKWVPVAQPKQHTQKELLEKLASLGDKHAVAKLKAMKAPIESRSYKGSVLQNKLKDKWSGAEIQSVETGKKYKVVSANPVVVSAGGERYRLSADKKYKITKPGKKIKEHKYKGYKIREVERGFKVISSDGNEIFDWSRFSETKEGAKTLVDKIIKEKKVKEKFLSKFSNPVGESINWSDNSGYMELDRYRRHDHGGGEDGSGWLDDHQIQEDFDQGVSEHGHKLKAFNKALSQAGYEPNAEFDLGEKGHFSINFHIEKKTRAVRRSLGPSFVIKAQGHKYIRRIPKAKGFQYIYKEASKKKAITNDLAPPPPENRPFIKPGNTTTRKDVVDFISHFESDFKSLSSMDRTLKSAGATHFASRLKDSTSLLKKMHGRAKSQTLNQVADVIGARGLAKDLKDQKRMLKSISGLEIVNIKDSSDKARADGYRAIHISFKTPSGKVGELQIKTHRQQVFSGFTHDAIYKGPSEVKNDPEVIKYSKDLSNYLYGLDQGKKDDASKRPKTPGSMRKKGIDFPWALMEEFGTGTAAELSDKKVKFFAVVRDHSTKENIRIVEFDNFRKAKAFRDSDNFKHEIPIAYAKTKEEFLEAFTEYRSKETKKSFFVKTDPKFVIDLIKAAGHKYIRKFRRNNKWVYTYYTETGISHLEEKDLSMMKELASRGDRHAIEIVGSIQGRDEKELKLLRELADRGDKHAIERLESYGIKREKERLEEDLAFAETDELDEPLIGPKLNAARVAVRSGVVVKIFNHLGGTSRHASTAHGRAIRNISQDEILRKVNEKKSVRGMLMELDEQLKKIDKAHQGLPPSQRAEINTAGGYGNYAYNSAIKDLESRNILPPGYSEVHKRGQKLPDPKKIKEERARAERDRREEAERRRVAQEREDRAALGELTDSMAYHMVSLMPTGPLRRAMNPRDIIKIDNAIKGIFGKSLKKEDWPYDFSAQGFKVTLDSVVASNNQLRMDLSVRDASGKVVVSTGDWQRTWNKKGTRPHIHNDLLVSKGGGVGELINKSQFNLMKKLAPANGEITVHAALGVGGYIWCNQGFSFDSDHSRNSFQRSFKIYLEKKGIHLTNADMEKFSEPCHLAAFNDGKLYEHKWNGGRRDTPPKSLSPKQIETKSLSGVPGQFPLTANELRTKKVTRMAVHLGKDFMLGKSWHGIWKANKETQATKFFDNYAQLRLGAVATLDPKYKKIVDRTRSGGRTSPALEIPVVTPRRGPPSGIIERTANEWTRYNDSGSPRIRMSARRWETLQSFSRRDLVAFYETARPRLTPETRRRVRTMINSLALR